MSVGDDCDDATVGRAYKAAVRIWQLSSLQSPSDAEAFRREQTNQLFEVPDGRDFANEVVLVLAVFNDRIREGQLLSPPIPTSSIIISNSNSLVSSAEGAELSALLERRGPSGDIGQRTSHSKSWLQTVVMVAVSLGFAALLVMVINNSQIRAALIVIVTVICVMLPRDPAYFHRRGMKACAFVILVIPIGHLPKYSLSVKGYAGGTTEVMSGGASIDGFISSVSAPEWYTVGAVLVCFIVFACLEGARTRRSRD